MRRFNLAHAHVSTFQRGVSRVIISKISKQLSSSLWKASSPIRQPLSPAAFASVPRAVSTISFSLPHPLLRPFLHQPPPALCLLPLASLKKIGENLKRLAPSIGLQGVEERERERGDGRYRNAYRVWGGLGGFRSTTNALPHIDAHIRRTLPNILSPNRRQLRPSPSPSPWYRLPPMLLPHTVLRPADK